MVAHCGQRACLKATLIVSRLPLSWAISANDLPRPEGTASVEFYKLFTLFSGPTSVLRTGSVL